MYTYNKNDKSYTFSSDELDIDKIVDTVQLDSDENLEISQESSFTEIDNSDSDKYADNTNNSPNVEDTLNTTDTSSDSNSSDTTSTSDFDNNSSTSNTSDASKNSSTSNTSDASKNSSTSSTSDASKNSGTSNTSDVSNNSSTSNTSDASNNSSTSNTSDASDNSDQPVREKPRKIEVINGGNDLDISPVTNYIEVEKPRNEKKENIVIPKNNKWHFGACP